MTTRQSIAEGLLNQVLQPGGFARCPGIDLHSKRSGPRDFQVVLDGVPTGRCFHSGCLDAVEDFNKQLRRQIWMLENAGRERLSNPHTEGVAIEPRRYKDRKRQPLNEVAVQKLIRPVADRRIDEDFLRKRSPLEIVGVTPESFLDAVFHRDDRVLVFTSFFSQGDFLQWVGHGAYRLSRDEGVKAVSSKMPGGASDGVWFLANPVSGQWENNDQSGKRGRRHWRCVTHWRHLVLESDVLTPEVWLRVLVQLPLPILAVYTSGGKSIHALVRLDSVSKEHWDAQRDELISLLSQLGADPAAMTAVRLTRLPGCLRGDRKQRLLFLSGRSGGEVGRKIMDLPELRE